MKEMIGFTGQKIEAEEEEGAEERKGGGGGGGDEGGLINQLALLPRAIYLYVCSFISCLPHSHFLKCFIVMLKFWSCMHVLAAITTTEAETFFLKSYLLLKCFILLQFQITM